MPNKYDSEVYTDSVSSEVHLFTKEEVLDSKPGAVLSRFEFTYPPHFPPANKGQFKDTPLTNGFPVDKDGDLLVKRRGDDKKKEGVVIIEHQQSTSLHLVGEQVWRGALFLADYVLHCGQKQEIIHNCTKLSTNTLSNDVSHEEQPPPPEVIKRHQMVDIRDKKVVELAAGVGVTSIVAGMMAQSVLITDVDRGNILKLIEVNLEHNKALTTASMDVREIDFCDHSKLNKIKDKLEGISIILVADVVYNNDLTDVFFDTVHRLMSCPPNKTLLVALEKRYVFTMADMDTVAPCYEYFLQCLDKLQSNTVPADSELNSTSTYKSIEWKVEQVDCFPQYFAYERTRHLVLWKIDAILK